MQVHIRPFHQPLTTRRITGRQRGVVMFFALIVLVILLISGIIVSRSINASLYGAGNMAFRRDAVAVSDAVLSQTLASLANATPGQLQQGDSSLPLYSPVTLPSTQGIPTELLTSTTPAELPKGVTLPTGVKIYYIIDRLCSQRGAVDDNSNPCEQTIGHAAKGGSDIKDYKPPPPLPGGAIYRLSVRVDGPRGTRAFFQTVFSGPG